MIKPTICRRGPTGLCAGYVPARIRNPRLEVIAMELVHVNDLQSPDFKSVGNVRVKQIEFNNEAASDLS